VQIDQGKPDEALKTLSDPPGTFAARYDEVRGDAYYAKKDSAKAAELYKKSLGEGDPQSMDSALLALKIADLGLAPASSPPTAATALPPPASPAALPSSNKAKP
jgi:predicted negative regulator of RcsB-dependent stress response